MAAVYGLHAPRCAPIELFPGFVPDFAACLAVLPALEAMSAHAESIARLVSADDTRIEGAVRVTTTESQSECFVRNLPSLRERHPALTVEIIAVDKNLDRRASWSAA